jgi:4-hydroxybenzoate polyprenyltransferase
VGEYGQVSAWQRYQRGLRTIPIVVLACVAVWIATGGGYFWPGWVVLWAALAMTIRATRATRLGPPDEPDELEPGSG